MPGAVEAARTTALSSSQGQAGAPQAKMRRVRGLATWDWQ